jgi:RNA polymerase sigma factor (sigma-70 family)
MWQTAHFFDRFGCPVRILSLDVSPRHADGKEVSLAKSLEDQSPSVLAQVAEHEIRAMVKRFVNNLPKRDREIVRGVYWEGESQAAIANRLGVSKMAISKAMARIAKQARRSLSDISNSYCSN